MSGDGDDQRSQTVFIPELTDRSSVQGSLGDGRGTDSPHGSMMSLASLTVDAAREEVAASDDGTASQESPQNNPRVDGQSDDEITTQENTVPESGSGMAAGVDWTNPDPFRDPSSPVPPDEGYESERDVAGGIGPFGEVDDSDVS